MCEFLWLTQKRLNLDLIFISVSFSKGRDDSC